MRLVCPLFSVLPSIGLLFLHWISTGSALADPGPPARLAVAWNDLGNRTGWIQAVDTAPPWSFVTDPLEVGRDAVLRYARGRLYVVQPTDDRITVVDPAAWSVVRHYALARGAEPEDVILVSDALAYVSARKSARLIRLNLDTGAVSDGVDLERFADEDRMPDLGSMEAFGGRLFVQVRRLNDMYVRGHVRPAYLAVVDLATGQLVDVDPLVPGVQAIELAGTAPKRTMRLMPSMRRLFVSATGGFMDDGGIEMIDLDSLRSLGLVVHESDGLTGADTEPFVLVSPDRGYLVYTTDLTISSHLNVFTLSGGPEPLAIHTGVDFLAPNLVYEPRSDRLFFPHNASDNLGLHVFDGTTGERLTQDPVPMTRPLTDLTLLAETGVAADPAALEVGLHAGLRITGTVGGTYQIQYAEALPAAPWITRTQITLTASPFFWADPDAVTNRVRRFYRAVAGE